MIKKDNSTEYQIIKTIEKSNKYKTFLVNKNCLSFKNIIKQVDLLKLTDKEIDELEQEINIISTLNSDYVIKIKDYFQTHYNLYHYFNIVTEYFESMTLKQFLIKEKKRSNFL